MLLYFGRQICYLVTPVTDPLTLSICIYLFIYSSCTHVEHKEQHIYSIEVHSYCVNEFCVIIFMQLMQLYM